MEERKGNWEEYELRSEKPLDVDAENSERRNMEIDKPLRDVYESVMRLF